MKKTEQKETLLHRWLRYSKRIALVGLVQWIIVAAIAFGVVFITMCFDIQLDDYNSSIVRNVVTASSGLAVTTSGGYYAHSAYEKKLEQATALELENDEEVQG